MTENTIIVEDEKFILLDVIPTHKISEEGVKRIGKRKYRADACIVHNNHYMFLSHIKHATILDEWECDDNKLLEKNNST